MTDQSSGSRVRALRIVTGVRRGLTATAVGLLIGFGGLTSIGATEPVPPPGPTGSSGAADSAVTRLMERHRCSATGFNDAVIPPEAILRLDDGHTRVVSFDRGWASFTGEAPGTLVAVCLGNSD